MGELTEESPGEVTRDTPPGRRARAREAVSRARQRGDRLTAAQRVRIGAGTEVTRTRLRAWLRTEDVTDAELVEEITPEPTEDTPSPRPPTKGQITRARLRKRLTRWVGLVLALLLFLRMVGQFPALLPLAALLGVAYLWWSGRAGRLAVEDQADDDTRWAVRAEEIVGDWPEAVGEPTVRLDGARIVSHKAYPWGLTARVRLPKGRTPAELAKKSATLASALDIPANALHITGGGEKDSARTALMRVVLESPWKRPIPGTLPDPGTVHAYDVWRPGVRADGAEVVVETGYRSFLVVGENDSGKSVLIDGRIAHWAACPDAVLWGADLAGGASHEAWDDVLDRAAHHVDGAVDLIHDALRVVARREKIIARRKAQARDAGKAAPSKLVPSPRLPALYLVIDEFPTLMAERPEVMGTLVTLVQRSRKTCVHLVIGAQGAGKNSLGTTEFRAELKIIIGLRLRASGEADLVFGPGSYRDGWKTDRLNVKGAFLPKTPELTDPAAARGYFHTDEEIAAHAGRCPRTRLDAASEAAVRTPRHGQNRPGELPAVTVVDEDQADEHDGQDEPDDEPAAVVEPAEHPAPADEPDPPLPDQLVTALEAAGGGPLDWRALSDATGASRATVFRHMADLVSMARAEPVPGSGWRLRPEPDSE